MPASIVVIAETGFGELTPESLECVEEAREVADGIGADVHAILPGDEVEALADELAAHGADRVTVIEHQALAQFTADGWLAAVPPLLQEARPILTLAPDSGYTCAWLPRLSVRWRIPMATGCIRVKLTDEGYPEVFRVSHNGRLHERQIWARGTAVMVLLCPGVRGVGPGRADRKADVRVVRPALTPSSFRDRTLRTHPPDPQDVDLGDAERIVSGGLGVGGPEGMAELQQLADELKASLGGTRVVADRGWLAHDRYIGTTGKIVAPKLYLALGVSGAGQHVAGITGSETVIAINTDRTAPLLKMADLGVVGDLHQIVPILIRKLRSHADAELETSPGSTPAALTGEQIG
ncbi:electron transfer flavoprotein subunit alpha/FixB family protein [Defluviicoccus vanus]|uniref:Electron transfer flavoprotein subunit alpha/FixB family protein n=1 Tax=Defluviicoccus vanus TaxID=111831 RepID=A0A7H1N105_9PROT|nr:electron transfer flavoprotein subunit alpha/FixB family protein [Defluviicoccus vanus]QNT69391.1 electron transfer flavoprotein subunit alpha/FixB family protein [Defluviicoccus vanus]